MYEDTQRKRAQSILSKADTLGTKATVRFRESSGYLIPEPPNWNLGFCTVNNDHMTDQMRLF